MTAWLIGLAAAGLLAGMSAAEARPDARTMTCAQVNALVREQGPVVISTGRHTYRRFVNSRRHCERDQILRPLVTRTADRAECPVRSVCAQSPFHNLPGFGDGWH